MGSPFKPTGPSSEWLDQLLREVGENPPVFRPHAYYSEPGDFIKVYLSADSATWSRLAEGIDIGRSESGEVVAVQVHGIKRLMAEDAG